MISNLIFSPSASLGTDTTGVARRLFMLCLGLLCGCGAPKITYPTRSAVEQLLVSRASDRVMDGIDLTWVQGKKIYVEEKYFDAYDKAYAIAMIRQRLSQNGALFASTNDAEIIIEIRSAALSVNSSISLLGIPSIVVPNPVSGNVQTPELALYKSEKADSFGQFVLFAYTRNTGQFFEVAGPGTGCAHYYVYKIIGITLKRTDVPELRSLKK